MLLQSNYETMKIERGNRGIAVVTLNRPDPRRL